MEPEGSLPCPQQPATGPYPDFSGGISFAPDVMVTPPWLSLHGLVPDSRKYIGKVRLELKWERFNCRAAEHLGQALHKFLQ
jgi:hypothetical protein